MQVEAFAMSLSPTKCLNRLRNLPVKWPRSLHGLQRHWMSECKPSPIYCRGCECVKLYCQSLIHLRGLTIRQIPATTLPLSNAGSVVVELCSIEEATDFFGTRFPLIISQVFDFLIGNPNEFNCNFNRRFSQTWLKIRQRKSTHLSYTIEV
jgi:hypothetical protein